MDKVIYNVASYKRADTLIKTIESIYNQCDVINVALNNYNSIPFELYDPKINLFISDNDRGDAYKFYRLMDSDGYFFTIDDDLIYPDNYTQFMIDNVNLYGRKSIITLHARTFPSFPINSFYGRNTKVNHFRHIHPEDTKVQFGGTGVMCFHTDLFKVPIEYFDEPNMADVWIGKYAKENNINIICVKHDKDYVTQQEFDGSIYNKDLKDDSIQTSLTNECYLDKKISVIIPTYNNIKYLNETINSTLESLGDLPSEILIGIDSCEKTLEFIKNNKYDFRVKFFYFPINNGPYIIKNTLVKISKSNNILFFDSDDIMSKNMVTDVLSVLEKNDCARIMLYNFNDGEDYSKKISGQTNIYGEGVFGIKKEKFLTLNGFEPWRCAADTEFMLRMRYNRFSIINTQRINMIRRIHSNSLTTTPKTSYNSKLRQEYIELTSRKKEFTPLETLSTSEYSQVYTNTIVKLLDNKGITPIIVEETPISNAEKIRLIILGKTSPFVIETPKVVEESPKVIEEQPKVDIRKNILNLLSKEKVVVINPKNKEMVNKQRELIFEENMLPNIKNSPTKLKSPYQGMNNKKGGKFNF